MKRQEKMSMSEFMHKYGHKTEGKTNIFGYSSWEDYYERGVIPNIWKGITGQTSADRNADAALAESAEQYRQENLWQREKYASDIDFANRQLQSQIDIADKNFGLQQQQFQYQKDLNELQMAREDNAIQRQVADYAAAGFSPLAAIGGNGSAAGSLNAGTAPQYDGSGISAAAGQYLDIARQYASLHQELSSKQSDQRQAARFALNQMKSDMHYKGLNMATQYFNSAVNYKNNRLANESLKEDIKTKKYQNDWYEKHGYSQTTLATVLSDFLNRDDIQQSKQKFAEILSGGLEKLGNAIETASGHLSSAIDSLNHKDFKFSEEDNKSLIDDLSETETQFLMNWCKKHDKSFADLTLEDWFDVADLYSKEYKKNKRK